MTQVVALMNYGSGQARFARSLTTVFHRAGFDLQLRTHRELVAEVTIEQCVGQQPRVEPDRPLLWLAAGDWAGDLSPDGRFLAAETVAAARSIATLTLSPVLNRPTAVGSSGRLPPSSALSVRQARRILLSPAAVRTECFTGTLPDRADDGDLEIHDYSTGRDSYGPEPDPIGPFRHRRSVPRGRVVKVLVVGDQAIATTTTTTTANTTTANRAATIDASMRIASWYQLDLVTVWWLVDDGGAGAILARIDCSTWDQGLDTNVDAVAEASLTWLSSRIAHRTSVEAVR